MCGLSSGKWFWGFGTNYPDNVSPKESSTLQIHMYVHTYIHMRLCQCGLQIKPLSVCSICIYYCWYCIQKHLKDKIETSCQ